jgi:hypothetical protein
MFQLRPYQLEAVNAVNEFVVPVYEAQRVASLEKPFDATPFHCETYQRDFFGIRNYGTVFYRHEGTPPKEIFDLLLQYIFEGKIR